MTSIYIIIASAVWVVVGALILRRRGNSEVRRAERHMAARDALSDEQFGERFFPPDRAKTAARLRAIMARHIAIDLSRLHPDDEIVEDIRMDALDSMSTVIFLMDVEKEFGLTVPQEQRERMPMKLAIWAYSAAVALASLAMVVLGVLFQILFDQLYGPNARLPLLTHCFVHLHWWHLLAPLPVLVLACFLTSTRKLAPDHALAFAGACTLIIVFLSTVAAVSLLLPLLTTTFSLSPR